MRSSAINGVRSFLLPDESRRTIHAEEINKVHYLRDKLIKQLSAALLIFVYKRNAGVADDQRIQLHDALLTYNPDNALLVVEQGVAPGSVNLIRKGLMGGQIDKLAPYERADDISERYWFELCEKALDIHPVKGA